MAPPQLDEPSIPNLLGAILFSGYVTAAVLLTAIITYNLYGTHQNLLIVKSKSPDDSPLSKAKHVQLFASLAALSFSVLSYHMMHFLVVSYVAWSTERQILIPDRLFGEGGLIGRGNSSRVDLHIWHWLTTSTLFLDFAEIICQDGAKYWWTQQALLVTMACCHFMAIEGRRRNIPHLWAYLAISQILPISFAQNLFFTTMLLYPAPDPSRKQWIPSPLWQILPLTIYYLNLVLLPRTVGTRAFIPVILGTRILLICPLLISDISQRILPGIPKCTVDVPRAYSAASWCIVSCSVLLFVGQTIITLKDGTGVKRVAAAINDQPAVSALGWDFLLSVVSCTTWLATCGFHVSSSSSRHAVA